MVKLTSLALQGRASFPATPQDAAHELLVLATLAAKDKAEDDASRAPVDVVCVLDRSGSMEGEKLALCIKTLQFLVTGVLSAQDRFGLVTFDTDVSVVFPPLFMTQDNKDKALSRINGVRVGSSTNLSGGLFAGIEQMLSAGAAKVSTILCLTDGLMNHGVTDKHQLMSLIKSQIDAFPAGRTKPSIYTFGFGSDCDAEVLTSIAAQTGGNFYSILSLDGVSMAFADVLGGVLATTCQAIKLVCQVKTPATFAGPALTKFTQNSLSHTTIQVEIKDMFAGERRDVLFKVAVPKGAENTEVSLHVAYLDIPLEQRIEDHFVLCLGRTPGSAPVGVMDVEVGRQFARYEAVERMAEAKEFAATGKLEEGKRVMQRAIEHTRSLMQQLSIVEEEDAQMHEIVQDLTDQQSNMVSQERWRTVGFSKATEAMQSHSTQRANKLYDMSSSLSSIAMAGPTSAYQTKSSNTFMKSAATFFKS